MATEAKIETRLLETIIDALDIPKSYYEKAVRRHQSLGEWLCRPESKLARFQPHVSPQGSFRYGTVNRPLSSTAEYDLDNVTMLTIQKTAMTQQQLKRLHGEEITAYGQAHGMLSPVIEKNRCWRLVYSDDVPFHLDTLPCVPEERAIIDAIIGHDVPPELARRAVAITDLRHPLYKQITSSWPSSNPRGFARWFEERARPVAAVRIRQLLQARAYASVDDVPPYEWKTPLQRSIQILKRHRDVMFHDSPQVAPISMIITNLAARAYQGETDLWVAITNIVERMPSYVKLTRPRVPNPTDPAEDYADRWSVDPALEENFWAWHTQVKSDLKRVPTMVRGDRLGKEIRSAFQIELTENDLARFARPNGSPIIVTSAPPVRISSPPQPWGR
jgi:hypothetical protein